MPMQHVPVVLARRRTREDTPGSTAPRDSTTIKCPDPMERLAQRVKRARPYLQLHAQVSPRMCHHTTTTTYRNLARKRRFQLHRDTWESRCHKVTHEHAGLKGGDAYVGRLRRRRTG